MRRVIILSLLFSPFLLATNVHAAGHGGGMSASERMALAREARAAAAVAAAERAAAIAAAERADAAERAADRLAQRSTEYAYENKTNKPIVIYRTSPGNAVRAFGTIKPGETGTFHAKSGDTISVKVDGSAGPTIDKFDVK